MNERKLEMQKRALQQKLDKLKGERDFMVSLYHETNEKLNQAEKENKELQESYEQLEQYEQTWEFEDKECLECSSREEQYQRIRSAFDRRKQQHQAIAEFFKHYHFTHNGQRISLTKLIQYGLDLQKQK